jgi:hypothetical protein
MHTLLALIALVATTTPAYARFSTSSTNDRPPVTEVQPPPINLTPVELPTREVALIQVDLPADPRVRIDHSASHAREVGDVELVTMTITASSSAPLWHAAELIVSIPRAARVIGLAIEQGGAMQDARLTRATAAREHFTDDVRLEVDPALVELESHVRDYDRLRLSIYPVSNEQQTTVELTIRLPRVDRLVVELAGKEQIHEGDADAPTSADVALLERPAVTGGLSLYIAPAEDTATEPEIRNLMRAGTIALDHCLSEGARLDLVAHFTIETDGSVTSGAAPDDTVAGCIAHTLGSWHFHRGIQPVVVDYPLHLEH